MDAVEIGPTKASTSTGPSRRRILASRILLALFCLSIVLSVVAIWARNQIDDTDRYVRTVAPLASDPAIQTALTDRVTTQVSALLEEVVAREGLLDRDGFLAAPLVFLLEDYVNQTVQTVITSDRFPEVWEEMNRVAHPVVSAVLTGSGTESVSTAHGQITLDLAPLITEVINRLRERGIDIVDRIQVDQLDTTFIIFESQDLADAQMVVGVLEALAIWLPVLALVSLGASLILSVNRRQTIIWGGLGLAAAMAMLVMLLTFARWWTVGHLPPDVHRDAATAFFETIGRYLRDATRLLSLLGLLIAAVAFVTRPGSWLSRERQEAWRSIKTAWRSVKARWPGLAQAGSWSNEHRLALAIALGVGCCVLAIAWDPLSIYWVTAILVMLAVGIGALWLLRARMGPPAHAGDRVAAAGRVQVAGGTPSLPAPTDDSRAELVALADELPADDVRILRRLAAALRDSG
jgi:hypothetical protein